MMVLHKILIAVFKTNDHYGKVLIETINTDRQYFMIEITVLKMLSPNVFCLFEIEKKHNNFSTFLPFYSI